MPEQGSRTPASSMTATDNLTDILDTSTDKGRIKQGLRITDKLRQELSDKGLKGFKRGGKVKETGVYKLHKGERVLTRRQALYGKGRSNG
jgi:hypothetical protein